MLAGWWRLLPVEWQMGLLGGGALVLLASYGGVYAYGDHQGAERTDLRWQVKWDERELEFARQRADEHDRQDTINTNAKLRERDEIAKYQANMDALQQLNAELTIEAAAAPGANDVVFDKDAIDRYNRAIAR